MAEFDKVQDHGGKRELSETGGEREAPTGKGRFDLIPPYPIYRLARHYEAGSLKYSPRNWQNGLPLARFIESAYRHLNQFMDNERSEDHLAAVMWNIAGYIHTEREILEGRLPATLMDVPWPVSTPEPMAVEDE